MPKKLNVSSNERIDLDDFNRASSDYTQESGNFSREKLMQARRSLVSGGFRIEISDQATSPGQFTIYNGVALDKSGNLLNNEQQVADARTLTLSGAGLSFYVEIEFVEAESDVDSRAFWDPTFSGNTPPGKEFSLNVATRLTPDWQVVQPVATTSFDTAVNSARIPVAVLTTNGSNEISGFTAVNIATVLEEDVAATATEIRVLDSTLFPTTGTATLGFGDTPNESVSITANDRTNGIITVNVPLTNAYQAGAVLIETGVTAAFVPEDKSSAPSTVEDRRRRLFAGDEDRGSALSADPQDTTLRSDLQVKSLKDQVDFLASQIRELKFGSLRIDETSTLPPSTFASTRHYDAAGSVTGARTRAITVGDGVSSFGDLNTDTADLGTILDQAHAALNGTNGGSVFVKAGTYVFDAVVNTDRPLTVEFDTGVVFGAGTYSTTFFAPQGADKLKVIGAPDALSVITGAYSLVSSGVITGTNYEIVDSYAGALALYNDAIVVVKNSTVTGTSASAPVQLPSGASATVSSLTIRDSSIRYEGTASLAASVVAGTLSNCTFENCTFDAALDTAGAGKVFDHTDAESLTNLTVKDCSFTETQTGAVRNPFDLTAVNISNVLFRDCTFDHTWTGAPTTDQEKTVVWVSATEDVERCVFDGCDFSPVAVNGVANTTEGSPGRILSIIATTGSFSGKDISIRNCLFGHDFDGSTAQNPSHFVRQIHVETNNGSTASFGGTNIVNNTFQTFTKAVYIAEGAVKVQGNTFVNNLGTYTADLACVQVVAGARVLVDTNDCFMDATALAIASEVNFVLAAGVTSGIVISNNAFTSFVSNGSGTADHFFIKIDNTDDFAITGNRIKYDATSPDTNITGIQVDNWSEESSITGNTIFLDNFGTGVSKICRGISIVGTAGQTTNTGGVISGNDIELVTVDDVTYTGIFGTALSGWSISNNRIACSGSGDRTYGIDVEGSRLAISGNTINTNANTETAAIYIGRGIRLIAAGTVDCNYCSITGNAIDGGYETRWGIHAALVSNTADMIGLSITGNTIQSSSSYDLGDHGGIQVEANSTGASGGWTVTGNTVVEDSSFGTTTSKGLFSGIFANGTSGDTDSVVISGNSIFGDTGTVTDRTTGAGIKVDDITHVSVVGNIITQWSGSTKSGRCIYLVSDIDHSIVGSNICDVEETTVVGSAYNFSVGASTVNNTLFHANVSIGANIITGISAASNETESDNKIT